MAALIIAYPPNVLSTVWQELVVHQWTLMVWAIVASSIVTYALPHRRIMIYGANGRLNADGRVFAWLAGGMWLLWLAILWVQSHGWTPLHLGRPELDVYGGAH